MEKINFKDFKVIPDFNSVRNEQINDETYFSPEYSRFISNSRLHYINPEEGGSPQFFKNPPRLQTQSLSIGSAVHELILQPDEFELAPKTGKPGSKLGNVLDWIERLIVQMPLKDAIKVACEKADYYSTQIDAHINDVAIVWEKYSKSLYEIKKINTDKERIFLSDKDYDTVVECVNSLNNCQEIQNKLHPIDEFGEKIESHNEDAFFMDFIVTYKNKYCSIIPFKMKADNWTIDYSNKILTLNDLKTTGHFVNKFMEPDGSWDKYRYARQMYVYSLILYYYCAKNFGVSKANGWKLNANMLVVETFPKYWCRSFYVSDAQLRTGRKIFNECIKRVAFYNIFGYDKEVEFE